MQFIPCYYGSVNRWECDENDHLNVRFYAEKINQASRIFLRHAVGVASGEILSQHIRFVQEARIAAPLRVDCGMLAIAPGRCEVLALMRNNLTEESVAAFITELAVDDSAASAVLTPVVAPNWATPRGIDPADPYPAPESLQAAEARGFRTMGRGVITAAECDESGRLLAHAYIGRISDGMPNLWAFLSDAGAANERRAGVLGGAALEYHLALLRPLRRDDVFRQVSGVRALGNKTQHMVHMMFNETQGELSARAEAIGVAMDLESRRAVPISEQRRRQMQRLMLNPAR